MSIEKAWPRLGNTIKRFPKGGGVTHVKVGRVIKMQRAGPLTENYIRGQGDGVTDRHNTL